MLNRTRDELNEVLQEKARLQSQVDAKTPRRLV